MTSEESFRAAFVSLEVNPEFTEAVLGMRDGSRLRFCHRVGQRWARVESSGDPGLAGQMLELIGLFRLNRKHLDILFHDGSRWEVWFGYSASQG